MGEFKTLTQIRRVVERGDLLEFHRGVYSHYALYLGNDRVMDMEAENTFNTVAFISAKSLARVCGDSTVRVNNHDEVALEKFNVVARPVREIIIATREHENQQVPYSFHGMNSEHYCTLWRYGRSFSTQIERAENVAQTAVKAASVIGNVLTSVAIGRYLPVPRNNSQRAINWGLAAAASRYLRTEFTVPENIIATIGNMLQRPTHFHR